MQRNHRSGSALPGPVVAAMTGPSVAVAAPTLTGGASDDATHRTEIDVDVWGDINRLEYRHSSVVGYTIVKTWPGAGG